MQLLYVGFSAAQPSITDPVSSIDNSGTQGMSVFQAYIRQHLNLRFLAQQRHSTWYRASYIANK